MRPQSAKAKGRRLQQEVRDAILETFPHLQPDDVTSRSMGAAGTDILLSPAARRWFPYNTEAKNVERLNIWKAIAQAERAEKVTRDGVVMKPLVVIRKNNTPAYAVIPFTHFLDLIKPDGVVL